MWLLFESGVHSVYTIIGVGDTSTSTHTVYMCIAMCLHVCMFVCLHLCVCVSVYSRQVNVNTDVMLLCQSAQGNLKSTYVHS